MFLEDFMSTLYLDKKKKLIGEAICNQPITPLLNKNVDFIEYEVIVSVEVGMGWF